MGSVLANGVYGGDPRLLSARDGFGRLAALETRARDLSLAQAFRAFRGRARKPSSAAHAPKTLWSLAGGLAGLATALGEKVWDSVRLGTEVLRVARVAEGYQLTLGGAGAGQAQVDGVICALPPSAAAALLAPVSERAESDRPVCERVEALRSVRSSSIAVVHLGFREEAFRALPRGFGALDSDGSLGLLGVLFPSSLFPNRAPSGQLLLTCMLGGVLHPLPDAFDDEVLTFLCLEALRRLFGVARAPVFSRVVRWREAVPQPRPGHARLVAEVFAALRGLPPIALAGAGYAGVSVEQALQSGRGRGGAVALERTVAYPATDGGDHERAFALSLAGYN